MVKKGSLFFGLFLVLMIIGVLLFSICRSMSYGISLVREREISEKQYYLAYALESFVKHTYKDQCDKAVVGKTVIFEEAWPGRDSSYRGYVWIEKKKDRKKLFVELRNKDRKELVILSSFI